MIPLTKTHRDEIAKLCQKYHVRQLDVFGSAAREEDFTENSDLDFLVDYEPAHAPPALADFLDFHEALSTLLARKVDLTMRTSLRNPFLRASIERNLEPIHGA
jgi:predicted nucleotidyltransferase